MAMKELTSTSFKLPPLTEGSTAMSGMADLSSKSNRKYNSIGSNIVDNKRLNNIFEGTTSSKPETEMVPIKDVYSGENEITKSRRLNLDEKLGGKTVIDSVFPVARHQTVLVGMKNTSLDESNTIKKINWKTLREPTDMYYDTMKLLKQTSLNKSLFELYCWAARHTHRSLGSRGVIYHGKKRRLTQIESQSAPPAPLLHVEGQRYSESGQGPEEETKAIDAKLKKFTRAQWKTPGEISILLGKEKNKKKWVPMESPATLQCFASEMEKVWKTTTGVNKESEPAPQPSFIKRPIHPAVPTQSLVGLSGTRAPSAALIIQDPDSLLTIKTLASYRNKQDPSQRAASPGVKGQRSRDSKREGSGRGGRHTDHSVDGAQGCNHRFPVIISNKMATNMVTSINPHTLDPRKRQMRDSRDNRTREGPDGQSRDMFQNIPPDLRPYRRKSVVIPGPPPVTPLTLEAEGQADAMDAIDLVQAANSPPPPADMQFTAPPGFKPVKLPNIKERQNRAIRVPNPSPECAGGVYDSGTDWDPRSETSSRTSLSSHFTSDYEAT